MQLRERIETLAEVKGASFTDEDRALFAEFLTALNRGEVRAV